MSVSTSSTEGAPTVDPGGLKEYSVVFTSNSLNHMSQKFQGVMRDISSTLKTVYNADACILVPGKVIFVIPILLLKATVLFISIY